MPRAARKKAPLTRPTVPKRSQSHRQTQSTISSFHTLLKQEALLATQLDHSTGPEAASLIVELNHVRSDMAKLGGIEAYQRASQLGQDPRRGGDSSKVLVHWIMQLEEESADSMAKPATTAPLQDGLVPREKLRLLDIGAVSASNYASCASWINSHPIDINPQHPEIAQQDFFEMPLPLVDEEKYDVISCSLVLNFVGRAEERGRMLCLAHQKMKPTARSLLFLVLPLSCLRNSRYTSIEGLQDLMRFVGFELVKQRWRPGGKLGYWLWSWRLPEVRADSGEWQKKRVIQEGTRRNNFAILLP